MSKATGNGADDGSKKQQPKSLSDQELAKRRQALDAKLQTHVEAKKADSASKTSDGAGFANALRLSTEFVAGILVGTGLGWLIDQATGYAPLGMIVGLLLGFCAGVLNVLRSAKLIAEPRADRGTNPDQEQD